MVVLTKQNDDVIFSREHMNQIGIIHLFNYSCSNLTKNSENKHWQQELAKESSLNHFVVVVDGLESIVELLTINS